MIQAWDMINPVFNFMTPLNRQLKYAITLRFMLSVEQGLKCVKTEVYFEPFIY